MLAEYLHLDGEQRIRRNPSRDACLTIAEMRGDANPAFAADPHAFHTVEESSDHLLPVDSQCREQCCSVVFEATARMLFPLNRLSATEPDSKAHFVDSMPLDFFPGPGGIFEQFNARTHVESA
jgi:hypothetical protein